MLLIKENYHTGNNHGALYRIDKEFDEKGRSVGKIAVFMGNVICPDLKTYLKDNPDVQVANCLPEGIVTR